MVHNIFACFSNIMELFMWWSFDGSWTCCWILIFSTVIFLNLIVSIFQCINHYIILLIFMYLFRSLWILCILFIFIIKLLYFKKQLSSGCLEYHYLANITTYECLKIYDCFFYILLTSQFHISHNVS